VLLGPGKFLASHGLIFDLLQLLLDAQRVCGVSGWCHLLYYRP
jgi:hypothetical protein